MNHLTPADQLFTTKLTDIILTNLENESFGAKELAREIGMSSFNLNRKLHLISGKTITKFIKEVKLQKALEMLHNTPRTASEVGFKVGYSSPAYFSTCFSEYFGYPPGEVKKNGYSSQTEFPAEINSYMNGPGRTETDQPKLHMQRGRVIAYISSGSLFLLILMYSLFNLIPRSDNHPGNKARSIAVLPFINDSKDEENEFFINGVLEAILDNLSRIKDLEVRPRTSVEQYRNNEAKTIPQIAKELGVNYIIEGSGQKIGDQVSLYIQLIETSSDKHLFSARYNMRLEDVFNIQSEVAVKVATEIEAIIKPVAKNQAGKVQTTNYEALNLFLQANDIHTIAESEKKLDLDIKAERLYKRAIQLDSSFADPYVSLGWIILNRNTDSAMYLANKALHFNPEHPEANNLKGFIYSSRGMDKDAEKAFKLSIRYKPNNSSAYCYLGEIYFARGNCTRAIESQLKALQLESNSIQERNNVKSFCSSLYCLGFYREGEKYASRLLQLNNDSSYYYWGLVAEDLDLGNYESALKSALKMYRIDTDDINNIYLLMYTYLYLRDFKEAGRLLQKYEGHNEATRQKNKSGLSFGIYLPRKWQ